MTWVDDLRSGDGKKSARLEPWILRGSRSRQARWGPRWRRRATREGGGWGGSNNTACAHTAFEGKQSRCNAKTAFQSAETASTEGLNIPTLPAASRALTSGDSEQPRGDLQAARVSASSLHGEHTESLVELLLSRRIVPVRHRSRPFCRRRKRVRSSSFSRRTAASASAAASAVPSVSMLAKVPGGGRAGAVPPGCLWW